MSEWDIVDESVADFSGVSGRATTVSGKKRPATAGAWDVVEHAGGPDQAAQQPEPSRTEAFVNSLKRGFQSAKFTLGNAPEIASLHVNDRLQRSTSDILGGLVPSPAALANPLSLLMHGAPDAMKAGIDIAVNKAAQITGMDKRVATSADEAVATLAPQVVEQQAYAEAHPQRAATTRMMNPQGDGFMAKTGDAISSFASDPVGVLADIGPESAFQSIPAIATALVTRSPAAAASVMGTTSYASEATSGITDYLQSQGVNTADAASVEAALMDEGMRHRAVQFAQQRAEIIAPVDFATMGLSGVSLVPEKIIKNAAARELSNALVAQPIAQGAAGAGADVAAQLQTTGTVNPGAALAEMVGEFAGAPGEAASFGAPRVLDAYRARGVQPPAQQTAAPIGVPGVQAEAKERPAQETRQGAEVGAVRRPGEAQAELQGQVNEVVPEQDLQPRQPVAAPIPEGMTLDRARDAYHVARTDEERAAAAAVIGALQGDLQNGGQVADGIPQEPSATGVADLSQAPAGVAQSVLQGAAPAEASGVESGNVQSPSAPAPVASQSTPVEPVGNTQSQASGAPSSVGTSEVRDILDGRRVTTPERGAAKEGGGFEDLYQDSNDPDINAALGTASAGITVHKSAADLHPDDAARLDPRGEGFDGIEGLYDPDTGRVHIFESEIRPSRNMTRSQHKVWVAAHERSGGHAGLRGLFAKASGSNAGGRQQLHIVLGRAKNNPTVAAVVRAMQEQRPERGLALVEEAIVELGAAVETGRYDEIRSRYGIEFTADQRSSLGRFFDNLVAALRKAFGKDGNAFTDSDLRKLITDAGRYARKGEVRATSARSENRPPVAQRAFHGTPHKGIEKFDMNKIGTGEGNQAYGYGIYFAGDKNVGEQYRKGLSAVGRKPGGTLADHLLKKHGSGRAALEIIARLRNGSLEQANRMIGEAASMHFTDKKGLNDRLDDAENFIRADNNRGQLYQQELPEDNELLDYDAPLSEQPPAVRAALRKMRGGQMFRESMQPFEDSTGSAIYRALSDDFGSDQDASEALGEAGIPGLRYADGNSRSRMEDRTHNYVIWDQDKIGTPEGLIASRTSSGILRNMTPAEQRKVTDKVAAKIVAQLTKLPPKDEFAAVAYAGRAKRGWYRQSAEAISAVFGHDAPRFAGLLAAMSPKTSVQSNLRNALNTWQAWDAAGRPQDKEEIVSIMGASVEGSRGRASVLPAWINNSVLSLTNEDPATTMLSGPKVDSFMRNLLGNVDEVTNDAWMASFSAIDQKIFGGSKLKSGKDPGKGTVYLAMNVRVRESADRLSKLTGETWSPAEVQETVWSWAKTLYELSDSAGEIRTAAELIDDKAVTDELLQATPDFGTLFADEEYGKILEESGYGEQVKRIRSGRAAARQAVEKEPGTSSEAKPFTDETQAKLERRSAKRIDSVRRSRLDAERGKAAVTEEEEDIPFSRRSTVDVYGEDKGVDLAGAPVRVRIPSRGVVAFHGYVPAQQIAQRFAERNGRKLPTNYAAVDVARAERIAAAYDKMKHDPQDPEVKAAYAAMIKETLAQYKAILSTGLEIEFIEGKDPYAETPRLAILDVVENSHLWVYPTVSGYGSSELDVSDNPLLAETEHKIGDKTMLANDVFRVVHDYFGHIANGIGFRADGEENAWREHSGMYSPLARRAMTSETRGQNSWVNYGPHGEANQTASSDDTVFADQKAGLLPEWATEDGAVDDVVASRGFSAKPRQPDAVSVDAYHYSNTANLTEVDPAKAGTGSAGAERRRFGMADYGRHGGTAARTGFYVREDGKGVPGKESAVTGQHLYRVQLDNLYDWDEDPRDLVTRNVDASEEAISDAGFDGALFGERAGIDTPTAIVFDIGKKKIPVEAVDRSEDDPVASRVTPQQKQAQRQTLLGHLATQGYPAGQNVQQAPNGRWMGVKESADAMRIYLQDKMLPLLRAQEAAGAKNKPGVTSVNMADVMNAYRLETLMHGSVEDLQKAVEQKFILPIQERLKNMRMSVDTFQGYLLARTAEEVNKVVANIKGAMQDGAAGITTAEARAILAGTGNNPYTGKPMTAVELRQAAGLAPLIDGLRDATLDAMVDAGQITPKLRAQLKAKYPHYIPMRGSKVEDWMANAPGTGKGLSQAKPNIKRRLGRGKGNLPENILGEMAGDIQTANIAKAKAKVSQAFLRFALANPMPELYSVEPVDLEWKYSEATGEAYLGVKSAADDLERSMLVMHNGESVRIRFEDEKLRDAVMNMGVDDYQKFVQIVGSVNRWRSKVLTQWNPAFTLVNIARDAIFGLTAIASEKGAAVMAATIKNYHAAAFAIAQHNLHRPGDASVPDAQKTMKDWAAEAAEVGMKTGLTQVDDVVDLQRRMSIASTTMMQIAAEGKPFTLAKEAFYRAGKPLVDAIANVNDGYENAIRLSVYVALRKRGESKERAAEYAKNVTINFNRKGKLGPILNVIYLFYNASMQGTHAVIRVMRNPKVQVFLAGMAGLQAMMAMSMMGDDDDDGITDWDAVPDYHKRTSLIIPLHGLTGKNGDYFALPMQFGFNLFTYAGGRAMQWHMQGARPTDPNFFTDIVKSTSEAFMPIPVADGYGALFGDQIGFAMQLASNKDDLGRPIANEEAFGKYDAPKALGGRPDTPRLYHAAAQLLAKIGGGNLAKRIPPIGYLDVAPEQIEAVVNYMGGGLTSLGNKGIRWWEQMDAGNLERTMDEVAATPIAGRFVGTGSPGRAIADRYYKERGEVARKRDVLKDKLKTSKNPVEDLKSAGKEDSDLSGLSPDRYKVKTKGHKKGDIKTSSAENIQLKEADYSTSAALKRAEKKVTDFNGAIKGMRDPELTNEEAALALSDYKVKPAELGLPDGYKGDVPAPNRVRQRAIKILQEKRQAVQHDFLRSVNFSRRNFDAGKEVERLKASGEYTKLFGDNGGE